MDLIQAINSRRSVRDFSKVGVPFEIIEKALKLGLKAPSYNHLKQWDFILVKDPNIRLALIETENMIEEVTDELKQKFEGHDELAKSMYLEAIPKQKRMLLTAPEVLVMVYKPKTQISESKKVYDLNCLASVWCCIENILLSLCEDGVFGVTCIPQNTSAIKKILNIPQELEVAAIIPFGYKDSNAKIIPQKEVQLESVLHRNNW
ncbi:nitroreductase family protein [Clostridium sp.]|uniref:nitroreductase family protein n=1 Tax=Clostridium sp. TaxID=1506 RepID=UPI00283C80CD|nr:nitroreductase family protein [Clostridium sp.]MDR3596658.1 nitroreductase family protein [Clostridium sp.]